MALKRLFNIIGQFLGLVTNDLQVTGHPIIEGVTSTGATGTGKFVFNTLPTIQNGLVITRADNTTEGVVASGSMTGTNLFTRFFSDQTSFSSATTGAYASIDSSPTMTGTIAYNHFYSYEARNIYSGSGILDTMAGYMYIPTVSGPVTNLYGLVISDPLGVGTIGIQVGVYIKPLTRATTNYAIYADGAAPSYFGGTVQAAAFSGPLTGNASTATKLAATKTINTVAFDGSANISVPISGCSDYVAPTAWTPVLTFATPGDLSVTYSNADGTYCKRGSLVTVAFRIVTSAFTWTTASGTLRITGLPYTSDATTGRYAMGITRPQGITFPTGCTQVNGVISPNTAFIVVVASGSAATAANLAATNTTSGTQIQLYGSLEYWV